MSFDGGDYFDIGTSLGNTLGDSLTDMTISMWVNITSGSSNDGIFKIGNIATNVGEFSIRAVNDARIQVYFASSNVSHSYDLLAAGNWNHIVIVKQGTTALGYINGSLATPVSGGGSSIPSTLNFNGKPAFIGLYWNTDSNFTFNGSMDEIAIFNKALTADQIKFDIYEASTTANKSADFINNPNLPDPVAWYRMGD